MNALTSEQMGDREVFASAAIVGVRCDATSHMLFGIAAEKFLWR